MKKEKKRSDMKRSSLPYIFSLGILILVKTLFAYLRYKRKVKRYVRIFRKTLIRNGVPRKEAGELAEMISHMGIRDFSGLAFKWNRWKK
jgi:hypothetical protein